MRFFLMLCIATHAALCLSVETPSLLRNMASSPRASITVMANGMDSVEFKEGFGGCAPKTKNIPVWQGSALTSLACYLWYLGTNTKTNAQRELVEGPGVRRRALLVVLALQIPAAFARSKTGIPECTTEEAKDLVRRKLAAKGFKDVKVGKD